MDRVFTDLARIQEQIDADPEAFNETNYDVIFNMLENQDYQTVLNKISKNIDSERSRKRKRKEATNIRNNDKKNRSVILVESDEDSSSDEESSSGSKAVATASSTETRAIKASPVAVAVASPTVAVGAPASSTSRVVEQLKLIFQDRSIQDLQEIADENPGLSTEQLVSLILDQPETEKYGRNVIHSNEEDVSRGDTSGSLVQLGNEAANITLDSAAIPQALGDISDGEDQVDDQVFANLCAFLPHLDPDFLKRKAVELGHDEGRIQTFITTNIGKSGLPSRTEYDARQAKKAEIDKIKRMKVSDFIRDYDNPLEAFKSTATAVSEQYKLSCVKYLKRKFPGLPASTIDKELQKNNHHFLPTIKNLQNLPPDRKGKKAARRVAEEGVDGWEPGFLKEYVYYKLEDRIKEAVESEEDLRRSRVQEARRTGALFTCSCCFDDECLLSEVCMCISDHMFCSECIRRGSEVQIGDNKTRITCFQEGCTQEIELQVLKQVLRPKVYEKLAERRAAEEVAKADIDNLVQCPACNYAVIMPESEKLIRCRSTECGKISCRLCREESHLPLRCDEVEKDDEVKARTRLENAMTEAMIRECPKCKNRFFKTEGCNMMHCTCGATMCYLCRKPVPDNYKHFYGQGADPKPGLCPLFSDNKNLHKAEVLAAAVEARKGLETRLKHDPTLNLDQPPPGFNPNRIHVQPIPDDPSDSDDSDDDDDYNEHAHLQRLMGAVADWHELDEDESDEYFDEDAVEVDANDDVEDEEQEYEEEEEEEGYY